MEWETKQRLSPKISTTQLGEVYARARALGALGGKAAGAGGGGFMLFYCPFDRKHRIAEGLRQSGRPGQWPAQSKPPALSLHLPRQPH